MLDLTLEERRDYVVLGLNAGNTSSMDDEIKQCFGECLSIIEDADSIEEVEDIIDVVFCTLIRGGIAGFKSLSNEDLGSLVDNATYLLIANGVKTEE